MNEHFEIVTLPSGVHSMRSKENDETFHPVVGPMEEARKLHVIQHQLEERSTCNPLIVWDVGLGAAANAVALLEALLAGKKHPKAEIHSFDSTLAPLEFALRNTDTLTYLRPWKTLIRQLVENSVAVTENVTWHFHRGDFQEFARKSPAPLPHAVLYDPYSPASNPGMWTLEHFSHLYKTLSAGGPSTLTSYTRSTTVRVTLLLAGFAVGRGVATGEKEETTIAATAPSLLLSPLDATWLDRVSRSTRSAPLKAASTEKIISPEDFRRLEACILGFAGLGSR
jgi:tRNA U34 5-methylaminomethyl-2-thiouridine-forming methyltransferase MnmC